MDFSIFVVGVRYSGFMLVEAARRVESAAKEVLALVGDGSASCAEMREVLPVLKSASAAISTAQTAAAASIAARERHGDGGAEMLAEAAGLSRSEARGQVKTAATLRKVPVLREAVESGRVSRANARQLASAVEKAGAGTVESDRGLLKAAETMRPEQFAKEARRWSVDRQGDDGAGEHARQRARRRLRVWDGDDGMVHLHGEFDKVAGTRVANRLRHQARRLLDVDKKTPGAGRRSFDQCMADALDALTGRGQAGGIGVGDTSDGDTGDGTSNGTGARPPAADSDPAGLEPGDNTANRTSPRPTAADNDPAGLEPGDNTANRTSPRPTAADNDPAGLEPGDNTANRTSPRPTAADNDPAGLGPGGGTANGTGVRPSADICVMVHADDETAKLIAELPDRTRLPRSVLDALSCDAAIAGVICDRQGSPIWRSYASRGATETQRQILFAKYGGCFHCGANPGLCQIHHIEPVWLGGKTEINNLVPLCWGCHNLIHEHRWSILKRTLGHHSMHPPEHTRHGPAHQPDHPVLYRTAPATNSQPDPAPAGAAPGSTHRRRGPPPNGNTAPNSGPPPNGNRQREPALF